MNKTFTINLNGRVYHINDDAYDALNTYLSDLKSHFSHEEGSQEIMDDIEARIGELFTERMRFGMEVVRLTDVEDVIAIMGHPEEIEGPTEGTTTPDDESTTGEAEEPTQAPGSAADSLTGSQPQPKRLFRDPDDKIIAGVCSGLGAYFHTEPWLFRALFIIAFLFAFGSPILIYVILWIVIPEATTVAQKLQMRGEAPNVENIRNAINEGETASPATTRRSGLSEVLGFIVKFFAVIAGSCLGIIGLIILFFTGVFTLPFFFGTNRFMNEWMTPMGTHYIEIVGNPLPMFISCLIAIVLPIYSLIQVLLVRTKHVKPLSSATWWSILVIWLVSIGVIAYTLL